jgi:glycosyltransferase involved in cell wall biosynthesis
VAELIDDSVGRVIPIGDVAAIAAAVLDIASDASKREAMGRAALARSGEDRFKPDHIHRQIEAAYRDLIRSKASS